MSAKIAEIERMLSSLKHEVKDLHPHLRELFSNMGGIENVEYTHGQNEMGADFVLTKVDTTTGRTNYIGVVVKNKGITQGSIAEVERQIDECFTMPRKIQSGGKSVHLNAVWVVANGTISSNAQAKISEKRPVGVEYFSQKDLAQLMHRHEYKMSDTLPTQISICLNKQHNLAENLKKQSIGLGTLSMGDIFMQQSVIKREPMQYRQGKKPNPKRRVKKISIRSAMDDSRAMVLCGQPGCGKSKMLQNLVSELAQESEFESTKMIPILVSCQDMVDKHDKRVANLINRFEKEHGLSPDKDDFFYAIIIDGVDECGLSYQERLDLIKEWQNESTSIKDVAGTPRITKIIFSTRDNIEEKELNFPLYWISELSPREVITAIRKYLAGIDTVDKIVADVVQSDTFRSLPQTPLALVILINLLRDETGRHELPANLTELFAKYIEISLGRWDDGVPEGAKQKRYEALVNILTNIAAHMLPNNIPQLNKNEAKEFFNDYLQRRNLGIDADELFAHAVEKSNLLYIHEGMFQFRHRTLVEFFYSKSFSEKHIGELGEWIFDARWSTVVFFFVGAQKDCPALLKQIGRIQPTSEVWKVLKAMNMANILLAGYATPYTNIQQILMDTFVDFSQYLDDVLSGKFPETSLQKYSVMRVLAFFRFVLDYEYARPFFKPAIEESLLLMEDLEIDVGAKSTALFLLNLAHRSVGGEDIFSGMINKLGSAIPAHIQLAINHETDYMEKVSPDVKKYKRNIKRRFLASDKRDKRNVVSSKSIIASLYDGEIRALISPQDKK